MPNKLKMLGRLDIKGIDQIKRVYSTDGISPTLMTCGGGNTEVKIFDVTKYRVRKLTPTEYGRLQAFPVDDEWEQVVSDSQAYKQFGNAVTVNVVAAIAGAIKNVLDAHAPEATTDLSDAPEEIKEEIISNAKLLEIRDEQSAEVTSTPKTSGLEFFTDEELLAEISRRMAVNAR